MRPTTVLLALAIGTCGAPPGESPPPPAPPPSSAEPGSVPRAARPPAEPEAAPSTTPDPDPATAGDEFRGRPLLAWIADFAEGDESDVFVDAKVAAAEEALAAAGERGAVAVAEYVRDSGESVQPIPGLRDLLVPRLLALLQDPDDDVRAAALAQLARYASVGGYGRNDESVAAAVVPRLREEGAAAVLRGCGPAGAKYVGPLATALRDPDPEVRAASARGLAAVGRRASDATDDLVRCLGDGEDVVREAAVEALAALGVRAGAGAARALGELALRDPSLADPCLEALRAMGSHTAAAVPSLVDLVASDSLMVRRLLVHLLSPYLTADPRVRPALERLAQDADEFTAAGARIALAGDDPEDDSDDPEAEDDSGPRPPTPAEFRRIVADTNAGEWEAWEVIRLAGTDCREAAFEALASDLRPVVRAAILDALGNMGSAAAAGAGVLRKDLADDVDFVRAAAAGAVFNLTGDVAATLPVVRTILVENPGRNDFAILPALKTLRAMGPAAAPAVPEVRRLLRRPLYAGVIAAACHALGAVGPGAAEALPELLPVLDGRTRAHDWCGSEDTSWIRAAAAEALGEIGTAPAVEALREALDDPAAGKAAAEALAKLGR